MAPSGINNLSEVRLQQAEGWLRRSGTALPAIGVILVVNSFLADWIFYKDQPTVSTLCALAGALLLAIPIFYGAMRDILKATYHMNELVALAILAAFVMGKYQEAGIVACLMLISIIAEERTAVGAKKAIEGLIKMAPQTASRINADGSETVVEVSELNVSDRIRIRPGQNFPADGVVSCGFTTVNQASITGESLPVDKEPDDEVFAGTANLTGSVEVEVTRVGNETTLGKVRDLILAAENTKLPVMRIIDKYLIYYTPTVLMIAGIIWFFTTDMMRVVMVLVLACPCAIFLATPSATVAAVAAAARLGMIIKKIPQIETASKIDSIVFDKTGTLTKGNLSVTYLQPADGIDLADLLASAVSAESRSNHPAAIALRKLAKETNVSWNTPSTFREVAGQGVEASVNGSLIRVGRRSWLQSFDVDVEISSETFEQSDKDGAIGLSAVYIAKNRQFLGWIGLRDTVRDEARVALTELDSLGVRHSCMVTGDNHSVAAVVGEDVGISEIVADCSPQEKVAHVNQLRSQGATVAVVGDGVNDAPALAVGDISIAMGAAGSDIAVNTASVALMDNDLRRIPKLIELSRRTRHVIVQNLLVAILLIAGGLILVIFGHGSLTSFAKAIGMKSSIVKVVIASIFHNIGTIIVLFNSARLFRFGNEHVEATT